MEVINRQPHMSRAIHPRDRCHPGLAGEIFYLLERKIRERQINYLHLSCHLLSFPSVSL